MSRINGFIKFDHDLLDSAAWWALSRGAEKLLIDIWRRHNGKNNGSIVYSQREVMRRFECSSKTAVKWLEELQAAGFIVAVQRGAFCQKAGAVRATTWRLTMERCNGKAPTRDYVHFSAP
jgi:Transcriptional regulators